MSGGVLCVFSTMNKKVHWTEVKHRGNCYQIKITPEMLEPSGTLCTRVLGGMQEYVVYDRSYVLARLQFVLSSIWNEGKQDEVFSLIKEAMSDTEAGIRMNGYEDYRQRYLGKMNGK